MSTLCRAELSNRNYEMVVLTMEEHKLFYTAMDIATDLSISEEEAEKIIKELNARIVNLGGLCIRGKVSAAFYRKLKDTGFTSPEGKPEPQMISEKRLLNVSEFCIYSGLGKNVAVKFAEEIGIIKRIARRRLFDRVLFDKWCDENNKAL